MGAWMEGFLRAGQREVADMPAWRILAELFQRFE